MEIEEYQNKSTRTLNYDLSKEQLISNMVFGIAGESGEVSDILKKNFYQGHDLDEEHLKEEIGDLMFYIVNLATMYEIDMKEVLQINIDKLLKRYPSGFDINKSINRNKKECINCELKKNCKLYKSKDWQGDQEAETCTTYINEVR